MTALLTRIIPCQITQWVKPHAPLRFVENMYRCIYGFIGAELDDTNISSFSMIGQAVLLLLPFEVHGSNSSPHAIRT